MTRKRKNSRVGVATATPSYSALDDGPGYFFQLGTLGDVDHTEVPQTRRLLPADNSARKNLPLTTGVIDYFPDALTAVAEVSFIGNQKHNPGEPMHWSRNKSNDHADCIARHLVERGTRDNKGVRHSAQLAWRALALLQEELEIEAGLALPRGATAA